jgi:Zn-dependent protease with chaperone function
MNVDQPLTPPALVRDALVDSAIAGGLAILACVVAALAFVLKSEWYLSGSLIGAAIWSLVAAYNIRAVRRHRAEAADKFSAAGAREDAPQKWRQAAKAISACHFQTSLARKFHREGRVSR